MSLTTKVKRIQNVLIIHLCGELDHHTAEKVRVDIENELQKETYTHLILNLEQLHFMDSSGLGVILGRYKKVSQSGGKMILCSVQPSIYRLMEMSGLFKIISFFDNEKSALDACEVAL